MNVASIHSLTPVDRILQLAQRVPLFPCGPDKKPRVAGGFHAATQDAEQIRSWWRDMPDSLVGVPTGQSTGLVVVDYDPDRATSATHAWLQEHADLLCSTRSHKTGRGGLHYLFKTSDRYQTGVDLVLDGSPRRGIDLRANGGYVIWWPLHARQESDAPVAPLPSGLIDERRFDAHRDLAPLPTATPEAWKAERARVVEALSFLEADGYEGWIRTGMAIHAASGGSDDGFAVWHDWSSTGTSYDGIEDCRYHWASFGRYAGRGIGLGSLYSAAKLVGYALAAPRPEAPPADAYVPQDTRFEDGPPWPEEVAEAAPPAQDTRQRLIRWAELDGQEPPARHWVIEHWMSDGPMLFSGRGGAGKSTVAQTLGTALSLGLPYWAPAAEPLRVLSWQCEDSHDEMWRRQLPINRHFGAQLADLDGRLFIEPRLGQDNTLLGLAYGAPVWTAALDYLRQQVNDLQVDVLMIDNIAHTFGGNENSRHDVTMFVNGVAGLVTDRPFSVVLMGHVARAQGSEFAGSAAWENAVRMRWWLGHNPPDAPEQAADAPQEDPNVRYLAKRKANYSMRDLVRMTYADGVFVPEKATPVSDRYAAGRDAEDARLSVLYAIRRAQEKGVRVVKGRASSDALTRWMRNLNLGVGHSDSTLMRALDELLATGQVTEGAVGNYANRTKKIGLVAV
jgi:AAA domain/Bifunctional DNA primase/polymerase, N-terminal/Primase C terminal 2 (PriCT-2)